MNSGTEFCQLNHGPGGRFNSSFAPGKWTESNFAESRIVNFLHLVAFQYVSNLQNGPKNGQKNEPKKWTEKWIKKVNAIESPHTTLKVSEQIDIYVRTCHSQISLSFHISVSRRVPRGQKEVIKWKI